MLVPKPRGVGNGLPTYALLKVGKVIPVKLLGAIPFIEDRQTRALGRSETQVLVCYESVADAWPREMDKRIKELGYAPTRAERWDCARDEGDPALASMAKGNSLRFHEDALLAAERLREDLASLARLRLVAHDDNEEMFAGSTWGFQPDRRMQGASYLPPGKAQRRVIAGRWRG